MKKQTKLDKLLVSSGWRGAVARLSVAGLSAAGLYWLPDIYSWYTEYFYNQPSVVDKNRHTLEMYVVYFMLSIVVLYECVNAIRYFMRKKTDSKK